MQDHIEGLLGDGAYHVMLINKMGRVEAEAAKRDNLLPSEKREVFSMGFRLHQSLLSEFDDEFGAVDHFVIRRKKAKIVSVPLGQRMLIFLMDDGSDHDELVKKAQNVRNIWSPVVERESMRVEAVVHG